MPPENLPAPTVDVGIEAAEGVGVEGAEGAGAWTGPYLRARELEGRLYSDSLVSSLPDVPAGHPLAAEWRLRADSARRLVRYLSRSTSPIRVVEVGCGNGWLAHRIAGIEGSQVAGLDGNRVELEQARRVFAGIPNLRFVLGDVATAACPLERPTAIVLASVIQYVPDLAALLERLMSWLSPAGEVHILDSPLYPPQEIEAARARSRRYYEQLGVPEMAGFYHHHAWSELEGVPFDVLYDPKGLGPRVASRFLRRPRSPFPWIRIRGESASPGRLPSSAPPD